MYGEKTMDCNSQNFLIKIICNLDLVDVVIDDFFIFILVLLVFGVEHILSCVLVVSYNIPKELEFVLIAHWLSWKREISRVE